MTRHSMWLAGLALLPLGLGLASCNEDETSTNGSSLTKGEVIITVDSTAHDLRAATVRRDRYDTRSNTHMLGRLSVPEYGDLRCSFVSQLLPAVQLLVPDSIPESFIDSLRLTLRVPRGSLTGDSLAPQQLTVYRLTRPLPQDISNTFDPAGYYDPSSPIGRRSYTLSAIAQSDSVFAKATALPIFVTLPRDEAVSLYRAYKQTPGVFEWPAAFAQKMPGIYVEQNFGRGCVASVSKADFTLFWHHRELRSFNEKDEETGTTTVVKREVVVKDSLGVLTTAPEVLSSNNISYSPSASLQGRVAAGEVILTTPGGYEATISFPAQSILDRYNDRQYSMAVINGLSFSVPASAVTNDYGIGVAPYLLMVRTAEVDEFFSEGRIPDNKTSFYASYNSAKGSYEFADMRRFALNLIEEGKVTAEYTDYTLMPVYLSIESETNKYNGQVTYYVTSCMPYTLAPTMTRLHTDRAMVCFTFSQQLY